MRFQEAIKICLNKYIDFDGRASRAEYWYFFFFMLLAVTAAQFVGDNISAVVAIGLALPHISVEIRRLHDINKSGWWIILKLIPIANLLLLYWLIIRGDSKINTFGSPSNDPLHEVS